MFAVMYRWKLKPGSETPFRKAWALMTQSIRSRSNTGGSRLHHCDDGTWLAYAVWPSRAAWEAASALPSANPEASELMRSAIAERFEPQPLEVTDDLLGS